MTLDEWMREEEQRLKNGIDSWKRFQEKKENKTESGGKSMDDYDLADEMVKIYKAESEDKERRNDQCQKSNI